jgi:hypothetical protein
VAWGRKEKGKGGPAGTSAWRREKEERGPWNCSGQLGAGGNGPQQLSAGGAIVAKTGEGGGCGRPGASVTDRRDRGEAVPGGSGWGAREKEREAGQ